ncbi:Golgi SNAP receptor complex member 2-like [Halichondria panicea]|uniref:Golgi SNAP receptor complex member 2-like n=1 Tax=Halichondria panicea TaxID=6063 RepID=UPI00312B4778
MWFNFQEDKHQTPYTPSTKDTAMEQLHQQVQRYLVDNQRMVQELVSGMSMDETVLESRIGDGLQQLEQDCHRLQIFAQKQPPTQRQAARNRVDQLRADLQQIQHAYHTYQHRKSAAEQEQKQREELLSRRFTTNSESSITIDDSLHQNQRMSTANKDLDSLLDHGSAVLTSLRDQGFTLKGVRTKILDVSNTLGLSTTVMRLIEKRTTEDKWLFFGCLIVSSLIILLLLYYFIF